MLYATGMTEGDMNKPQVGIASVWWEGNPCNMHLLDLSQHVKEGVQSAGLIGLRFNTIGVSDGISMGTDGMSLSLQSRDLIADSIETVMRAQWYDGMVCIPGCDKNMPGCLIAAGRLNRPAIMVYGGTIKPDATTATRSISSPPSNPSAPSSRERSTTKNGKRSFVTAVRRGGLRRHVHRQHHGLDHGGDRHGVAVQLLDPRRPSR